ncbi:MAG: hypothetical protein ACMG6S_00380 [Byssovorax sp.]
MATTKKPATAKKAVAKKAVAKKAAAKKPKAAKRESVADSWAKGYQGFTDAARERFAFLVRDHGYAEPVVRVVPPDAVVTFTKGDSFVRISSEYAGAPWVVVKAWEGEPYGLHVIIAELDPDYAKQEPVPAGTILTNDEHRALIAYYATFLQQHASRVLSADPALVARFHAREAALRAQAG